MKTAVVIPCYKVESHINNVVASLPDEVDVIILVNDASPDGTRQIIEEIAAENKKVVVLNHSENQGVGGAMATGFQEAIRLLCDAIIKLDGDGQMDSRYIPPMIRILESGEADFVKGNRFFDRNHLRQMPAARRIGNLGMGFLIKGASGYWSISDPTNGYFAIRTSTLQRADLNRLSERFFFESSLLIELYYAGARIREIPMPAIYANEKSNLSITKTLLTFPPKLITATVRRLWLRYFVYDFNINSLYLLTGTPLFLFGLIYGIVKWIHYASLGIAAPTGTIMLAVLPVVLGLQILLASIQYDMTSKNPFEL